MDPALETTEPGTAYVSAPMRGIPDGNFPAIDSCAAYLISHGWKVYSPAQNDREAGLTGADANNDLPGSFKKLMRLDLWQVCDSDAIVLLPGWERSRGALLEKYVAEYEGIECEVLYAYPLRDGQWFISDVYMGDVDAVRT